ncbi:DNA-binding transcriptional regulator [Lysobacter pythonis]|uniref:DNA-binding transcriptional regulator n=1 Tax=Solilutibacter pythonis TaxID=2483112 RepID=A0A3M2HV04_9GAMM|nr:YerC/YecD family TrpR-related protein [Lysobacter pythonis]RMH90752.1 DNA-binding transcriptional regulator [Lysobacter pythonis]
MKQRPQSASQSEASTDLDALAMAMAVLKSPEEVRGFLEDLCTPAELEAMSDRWKTVPLLLLGVPYRDIHERTAVSVTTVGRVARTIEHGSGGYRQVAHRLRLPGA